MSFPTRKIRTARSASRRTLQPTVRDFSDQVIGCYSEDGGLYLGVSSPVKAGGSNILDLKQQSPRFAGSIVTYSTLEAAAHSHLPATFNTPRNSIISPEELHRRHVAKSARLRSRLSGNKQLQRTRVLDSPVSDVRTGRSCWQNSGAAATGFYMSPRPASGKEIKRPWSERSPEFLGSQTPRTRPATTGRYFNSSNGLRTSSSLAYRPFSSLSPPCGDSRYKLQQTSRPYTTVGAAWLGSPGLHINKMKLSCKEK
ncbi:hypothetical protein PoB_002908900 [Plakobranchus ocellatus]|uniref:Uncharacterized protein n=1 Tax=Plakobranchus ocellatus TaxID=259542 RepID=A0AAV4A4H5_9GAST|nr:hypothetical protein PoB_002908900 [Plakobranchus ocellatus]